MLVALALFESPKTKATLFHSRVASGDPENQQLEFSRLTNATMKQSRLTACPAPPPTASEKELS